MRSTAVVAEVSRIAAGQWGLLTVAQAERKGVTRLHLARLAEAGVLERVERGVYATTSSVGDEHRGLRTAWLALDPPRTAEERLDELLTSGVVSHASAAALHRLGDLLDDTPEVSFPFRKQSRRRIRIHRQDLHEGEVTIIDGLPTTTTERTMADLLEQGQDLEHVARMIGQGLGRGSIDHSAMAVQLARQARNQAEVDGQALLEHLLDLVGMSPAAHTRELANSAAGKALISAGQMSAIATLLSSLDRASVFAATNVDTEAVSAANALIARAGREARAASATLAWPGVAETLKAWRAIRPPPSRAQIDRDDSR